MKSWNPLSRIEDLCDQILANQRNVTKEIQAMAVNQQQFSTDVNTLQSTLTTGLADIATEVANLKAQNPDIDFSSLDAQVQAMTRQVSSADPGPQAAPTPTTAPAPTDPSTDPNLTPAAQSAVRRSN